MGYKYEYICPCGVGSEADNVYRGERIQGVGTCRGCGGKELVLIKLVTLRKLTWKERFSGFIKEDQK